MTDGKAYAAKLERDTAARLLRDLLQSAERGEALEDHYEQAVCDAITALVVDDFSARERGVLVGPVERVQQAEHLWSVGNRSGDAHTEPADREPLKKT